MGQRGDILMFTTRNAARPFVGRYALNVDQTNPTLQSDVAEVAWFLRGTTLHRRVLLVAPGVAQNASFASLPKGTFFANNDISARLVNGKLVPNSLGDLTKRENRFAHPATTFPFDARRLGISGASHVGRMLVADLDGELDQWHHAFGAGPNVPQIDMWDMSGGSLERFRTPARPVSGAKDGTRLADDVVLTNVIGFDVKVWEPAANGGVGGYVDLGYGGTQFDPTCSAAGTHGPEI